ALNCTGTATTAVNGSYTLGVGFSGNSASNVQVQAAANGYVTATTTPSFSLSNGGSTTKNFLLTAKINTTTTITTDLTSATFAGQGYGVAVSVAKARGSGRPTGTVTISDGTD